MVPKVATSQGILLLPSPLSITSLDLIHRTIATGFEFLVKWQFSGPSVTKSPQMLLDSNCIRSKRPYRVKPWREISATSQSTTANNFFENLVNSRFGNGTFQRGISIARNAVNKQPLSSICPGERKKLKAALKFAFLKRPISHASYRPDTGGGRNPLGPV